VEVMIDPLPETAHGTVSREASRAVMERAAWADAVAVGPGLSRDDETADVVRALLGSDRPLVIDADALGMLRGAEGLVRRRNGRTLLTPHAGEFCRMTGVDVRELERDRVAALRTWADRLRCAILLKGSPTLVAEPGGHVWFNTSGNPGMATAGSGDVLTGVAATLLAQGVAPADAGWAAAFLHGDAGDRAAAELGERSLMATDILRALPAALGAAGSR
jgi:NAD(P)H-hydrate epimerase